MYIVQTHHQLIPAPDIAPNPFQHIQYTSLVLQLQDIFLITHKPFQVHQGSSRSFQQAIESWSIAIKSLTELTDERNRHIPDISNSFFGIYWCLGVRGTASAFYRSFHLLFYIILILKQS